MYKVDLAVSVVYFMFIAMYEVNIYQKVNIQ